MPKRATQVIRSLKELEAFVQILKRHRSEQQQVRRSRIVLAEAQGHSHVQIARELTKSAGSRPDVSGSPGRTPGDRLRHPKSRRAFVGSSPVKRR